MYLRVLSCAAVILLAGTAYAQRSTTTCLPSEGIVLEYDFPLGANDLPTIESGWTPRLSLSDCAPGKPTKITFRGVNAEFKDRAAIRAAIDGARYLVDAGLTDPVAIKGLIDRVAALRASEKTATGPSKVSVDDWPKSIFSSPK